MPLVLVALLLGGFAYLPRSTGPLTARGADEKAAVSGADLRSETRSEVELVADYFAIDIARLARLHATACAREVVNNADPALAEQIKRLMTATGGTAPADLSTLM